MRTVAVLPVKRFDRAKRRLDAALGPAARRELAAAMVADVLDALSAVTGLDGVLVVTAEPAAARAAGAAGMAAIDDPEEAGHSAAAARGAAAARARGAERVLLVPGDCPGMAPAELGRLMDGAPAGPHVVVVPDRRGAGTNALLLAPPDAIAPSFGPGSLARHAALARAAGVPVRVTEVPSLALDVDTPDDLAAMRETAPAGAPRTHAALERVLPSAVAAR